MVHDGAQLDTLHQCFPENKARGGNPHWLLGFPLSDVRSVLSASLKRHVCWISNAVLYNCREDLGWCLQHGILPVRTDCLTCVQDCCKKVRLNSHWSKWDFKHVCNNVFLSKLDGTGLVVDQVKIIQGRRAFLKDELWTQRDQSN